MSIARTLPLFVFAVTAGAATRTCVPGSAPVAMVQLTVTNAGGQTMSISHINQIRPGFKVSYKPVQLPTDIRREARVALVLAPGEGEIVGTTPLSVLDMHPASSAAEWTIPFRVSVLMLIVGPQGLDEKRVTNFVTRDEDLISQVADYADQTAQLETTIQTLVAWEEDQTEQEDIEVESVLDRASPVERALIALLRAQNPSLATFNPLAVGRRAAPATTMGKVADGFFENAGSIVPGGGILPGVKGFFFPDTEMRSVYAQETEAAGLILCGKRRQGRSRTKIAYLWAHRVLDQIAPGAALLRTAHVPLGAKSTVGLKLRSAADWEILPRVRDWTLTSKGDGAAAPLIAAVLPGNRALELDLRKSQLAPGAYKLTGKWDWDAFEISGDVELHALPDLKTTQVQPASRDKLIEGSGVVAVKLSGTDFEFVERVTLEGKDLKFTLPLGRRLGQQDTLYFDVDTSSLSAGSYPLVLRHAGAGVEIPMPVLPKNPQIENLPIAGNAGEAQQSVVFRGRGLERIQSIESEGARIELKPTQGAERAAVLRLAAEAQVGAKLPLLVKVEGLSQPLRIQNAIEVRGPRPRAKAVKPVVPEDLGTALRQGELPAGSFSSVVLETENAGDDALVRLRCATRPPAVSIRLGERAENAKLEAMQKDRWYLAFDAGAVGPAGCEVSAIIDSPATGASDPAVLGRVTRLPRIASVAITGDKLVLRGEDLEVIGKVGWDPAQAPQSVDTPPVPVAGEGAAQILRVPVPQPPPTPGAPVHIWLWGEAEARKTTATLPQ